MKGKEFDRDEEIKKRKLDQGTPETRLNIYGKIKLKIQKKKNKKQKKNYIWLVSRR
jgi:hypothetical protein